MSIDWNGEVVDQIETHWQQRLRPRLLRDLYLRTRSRQNATVR